MHPEKISEHADVVGKWIIRGFCKVTGPGLVNTASIATFVKWSGAGTQIRILREHDGLVVVHQRIVDVAGFAMLPQVVTKGVRSYVVSVAVYQDVYMGNILKIRPITIKPDRTAQGYAHDELFGAHAERLDPVRERMELKR